MLLSLNSGAWKMGGSDRNIFYFGHISVFSKALVWGLEVPELKVGIANSALVQMWLEGTSGEVSAEYLSRHRSALQSLVREGSELVLVPIGVPMEVQARSTGRFWSSMSRTSPVGTTIRSRLRQRGIEETLNRSFR